MQSRQFPVKAEHCTCRPHAILWLKLALLCLAAAVGAASAAEPERSENPVPAGASSRTLHVVATAHLDTQWRWTIQDTINEYIPNTLRGNFALFEKFPHYTFSFEGAFRYMLAKEYYPEDYARLKDYIAKGRWRVCGSSVDAGDVNVPSPESLMRHVLYGNGFFKREFDRTSCDIFLPDCFGFGYALPSVASHCGLRGFSTQKLTWGSSVGIPFDIGIWEGVDSSSVIAAINPGNYVSQLRDDLSQDASLREHIDKLGGQSGAYVGYKYFGVGDVGGAPDEESVSWLEKSIASEGPIRVISVAADRLYQDLPPEQVVKLPRYKGELLMTRHGVGCYTSQAAMKRWNRKNELLADAAERASVVADHLGGAPYPKQKLTEAWIRFLWHQFHDDLTGTSIPQAYTFSWNDEIISLNQFSSVLTHAVGSVAQGLDTRAEGVALVVFNPLSIGREDVVEAKVRFPGEPPKAVRVYDPSGREVPSQVQWVGGNAVQLVFLADAPSVGFSVYDVRPSDTPCRMSTGLQVTSTGLENARYRVRIDKQGDVASCFDKAVGKEMLAGPARLQLLNNTPDNWPEWEIRYEDVMAAPRGCVAGPVSTRIVERGPARVTLEVTRQADGSTFLQRIRLGAGGAGDRVEFDTRLDWRTPRTLLKAAFPLTVSCRLAFYDLGLGTIWRGNNREELYEVPAQQWADLTARDGSYGVGILNDCKYGWDKPNDNTLRLTLLHSPNNIEKDMGWHRFTYALCGHAGPWREGRVSWQAARLNQPLLAFQAPKHDGELGKRFAALELSTPQVAVRALKQTELSEEEVLVRVYELNGRVAKDVTLSTAWPIVSAREVNGAEEPVEGPMYGPYALKDGRLVFGMQPYRPRSFVLKLAPPEDPLSPVSCKPVKLAFDTDVVSLDADKSDGNFDGRGHSLPGELLPKTISTKGIRFEMGPSMPGQPNALSCKGQTIDLPAGDFDRLTFLAAAAGADATGTFEIGGVPVDLTIQDFTGFVGQSQSLVVDGQVVDASRLVEPFIKDDPIAWVGTHRHAATGENEPYVFTYLFRYEMDLPKGAGTLKLPDNEAIRIMGITLSRKVAADVYPASRLYDRFMAPRITPRIGLIHEPTTVTMASDLEDVEIRFTLDGSVPTRASDLYAVPFELDRSATVRARIFTDSEAGDYIASRTFQRVELRVPENPADVVNGLDYAYYEGAWRALSALKGLQPVKSGTASVFSLKPGQADENFGLRFTGFLSVAADGVYVFSTRSDDGSRMYIGDTLVVDNDGLHGATERSGAIALESGKHAVTLVYFQRGGSSCLEVTCEGPGLPRQTIPASTLFRTPAGDRSSAPENPPSGIIEDP